MKLSHRFQEQIDFEEQVRKHAIAKAARVISAAVETSATQIASNIWGAGFMVALALIGGACILVIGL